MGAGWHGQLEPVPGPAPPGLAGCGGDYLFEVLTPGLDQGVLLIELVVGSEDLAALVDLAEDGRVEL